jgi:hypothetical protein
MNTLDDPKDWIPLKEVAHTLRVSRHTVVRLCEEVDPTTRKPYLRSWRVTPGTLLVARGSLEEYCAATQGDAEYWPERKPKFANAAFRARLKNATQRITESLPSKSGAPNANRRTRP